MRGHARHAALTLAAEFGRDVVSAADGTTAEGGCWRSGVVGVNVVRPLREHQSGLPVGRPQSQQDASHTQQHHSATRRASCQPAGPELRRTDPQLAPPRDAHKTSSRSRHGDGPARRRAALHDHGPAERDGGEPGHGGNEHEHEYGHDGSSDDGRHGGAGSRDGLDARHLPGRRAAQTRCLRSLWQFWEIRGVFFFFLRSFCGCVGAIVCVCVSVCMSDIRKA